MSKLLFLTFLTFIGLQVKAQYPSVSFSNIVTSCNFSGSAQAVVTGGVQPYTYEWYSLSSNNNSISNTSQISNVDGGYYWVKVTDSNGNYDYGYVTIPGPFQVVISSIVNAVCPLSNGSVTYNVNGGNPPYNAEWSNGLVQNGVSGTSFTASGLSEGIYYITISDANGCAHSSMSDSGAYVNSPASFFVTTTGTSSNCHDGSLTANISGPIASPYTYYWNSTPPQTTATATGLDANVYYSVTVTDANGCASNAYNSPGEGPNALNLYASVNNATCPLNNGNIAANAINGQTPYSYQWSTGETSQTISGLAPGHYTITLTDAAGCSLTEVYTITQDYGFAASYSSTQSGCDNTSGSATVNPTGGTAPYTILWNNGATSNTITGLPVGFYHAEITDANGCLGQSYSTYVNINPNCYASIQGSVYNDINGNCVFDGNETQLPGQIISLGNGNYTSTGNYGYFVSSLTPQTYIVNHTPPTNWNLICPQTSYTLSPIAGQVLQDNNFFDQPISLQNDLTLSIEGGTPRPGFSYSKWFSVYNNGTNTANGTLKIQHDVNEIYIGTNNASIISYDQATRTITISCYQMGPFMYTYGNLDFMIPPTVPLGTIISTTGIVDPVLGDITPLNNYDTSLITVVGSYDPNDKQVSPQGIGSAGLITANNEYSEYTIRFQNTGTWYAETVAIRDSLDSDLDPTSLQVIGASHSLTWRMGGAGILDFTFNNIYLPDSLSNEPESHGYVKYRIKQKANLSAGTEIKNTAYIYFDYNTPIVTNTTLNTIQTLGINENNLNHSIKITPNPATDYISISNRLNEVCELVELTEINGKTIIVTKPSSNSIALPDVANGVYIVKATFKSGIKVQKLIIAK